VPQPGRIEQFLALEIARFPAGEKPRQFFDVMPLGWRQIAKGLGTVGQTPPDGRAQGPYLEPAGGEYLPPHIAKRGGAQFCAAVVQLPVTHHLFWRRPALASALAGGGALAPPLAPPFARALAGAILTAPFGPGPAWLSRAAKGKAARRRIVASGHPL